MWNRRYNWVPIKQDLLVICDCFSHFLISRNGPPPPTQICIYIYGQESPGWISICKLLKMKNFFLISLEIPRPSPFKIHWQINFIEKIDVSAYLKKKEEKVTSFSGTLLYISVLHLSFFFENIPKHKFFLVKLVVYEFRTRMGGGSLRISKKVIFKTRQKMVTRLGQSLGPHRGLARLGSACLWSQASCCRNCPINFRK